MAVYASQNSSQKTMPDTVAEVSAEYEKDATCLEYSLPVLGLK